MRKLLLIFLLTTGAFSQNSYFDIQSYSQFKVKSALLCKGNVNAFESNSDTTGYDPERTPAMPAAITTQVVVGQLGGMLGFGVLGTVIGYSSLLATNNWETVLVAAVLGGSVGIVLGSASGVYLSGKNMGLDGSFVKTLIGGFAGIALGCLVYQQNEQTWGFFVAPPMCATITFHL